MQAKATSDQRLATLCFESACEREKVRTVDRAGQWADQKNAALHCTAGSGGIGTHCSAALYSILLLLQSRDSYRSQPHSTHSLVRSLSPCQKSEEKNTSGLREFLVLLSAIVRNANFYLKLDTSTVGWGMHSAYCACFCPSLNLLQGGA